MSMDVYIEVQRSVAQTFVCHLQIAVTVSLSFHQKKKIGKLRQAVNFLYPLSRWPLEKKFQIHGLGRKILFFFLSTLSWISSRGIK